MDLASRKYSGMKRIARGLVLLEIPFLTLAYIYFILSDQVPTGALILLSVIWAARTWLERKITVRTIFDLPMLIILVMLPISLWATSNMFLTLPKVSGIILSVAFFYAIVNHVELPRDAAMIQLGLGLICLAIAIAGLTGTDWVQSKIVSASFVYDRLPRLVQNIPRSIAGGFARNGIGGTLTFTIPLLAAMSLGIIQRNAWVAGKPVHGLPSWLELWLPRILVLALILSLVALALTQSRGGILGTGIGLIAIIVWKRPRLGLGIIAGVGIIAASLILLGQGSAIANWLLRTDLSDGTLASRLEVWQRGWMMVQDFPFTGIGVGTFNVVAHALYPFFIAAPDELVPHAHNQFLEVAVDFGIPGLAAYLALLAAFTICIVRAYRFAPDERLRAMVSGLGFGMLAHHVFGLTDAFILGSKPGLLMWIYFAIAATCYVQKDSLRA
jgi:O-antigen ligase